MTTYGIRFNASVAAELRAERARAEMTLGQIMDTTGLADSSVRRYLKGDRTIPMDAFIDICRALGADPHVVFTRAQESAK